METAAITTKTRAMQASAVPKEKAAGVAVKELNTTQLAFRFDLDRVTVRKRLQAAGIQPVKERAKEKLYALTPMLESALTLSNADIDAEKLRKMTAEADIKEMDARVRRGELAPVAEFTDAIQRLFGAVHKEVAVRFPSRISARVMKAKTPSEVTSILSAELNRIFTSIRDDHKTVLGEEKKAKKPKPKTTTKKKK